MIIGVDIDGVLINSQAMWREKGLLFNKYNKIKCDKIIEEEFMPKDMFGWTDEQDLKFWKEYYEDYFRFALPIKHAVDILNKLKQEGHKIIIITNRTSSELEHKLMKNETLINYTKEWLNKSEIPYDDIFFCENYSKTKICNEQNVDIIIEDSASQVKSISNIIPVICFKRPYNKMIKDYESNYKIYFTEDWNMIYTIIEYRLER